MFATFRNRTYFAPQEGGYLKVKSARGDLYQVMPPSGTGPAAMVDEHTTSDELAEQIAKLAPRYNL